MNMIANTRCNQVATAFETVSEAAKTLTGAKEEATATLGAVAQAALALTGLANTTSGARQGHTHVVCT